MAVRTKVLETAEEAAARLPLTLAKLTEEFHLIAAELEGLDLEDAEGFERVKAMLDQSSVKIEDKVVAVAIMIREKEARAARRKDEVKRIARYAASDEASAEWLRSYLLMNMDVVGCPSVKDDFISVATGDNAVASMVISNEAQIPDTFKPMVPTLDKKALKAALEAGEVIPGAKLEKGRHVTIR